MSAVHDAFLIYFNTVFSNSRCELSQSKDEPCVRSVRSQTEFESNPSTPAAAAND
jgi:hypothetical protein